jgi:plasmid stabilization system protein ParE
MASGFKIRWTTHALSELSDTIKYLQENWTEKELIQFANAVDNTVEIISRHPEIYPVSSNKRKIRRAVVDKNNTLYYRVVQNSIQILSVFGTKQDPAKNE